MIKNYTTVAVLTVASVAAFASTPLLAGEGCSQKGKQARMGTMQPAVLSSPATDELQSGLIKVGHHMEGEKKAKQHGGDHHGMALQSEEDIVDTAISTGTFNTLVTAVKAAGLVDTLKGDGPFTVFAPTDEAFAKLPQEKLNALLNDKDALKKVLTYHVVAGKVMSTDVIKLKSAQTVEGQSIKINSNDGVQINNAKVIMADIITTNGIIHVVDEVILPPDMMASL
jgi:uncharacterized surface protein with fasciclin (FAS1) repeats